MGHGEPAGRPRDYGPDCGAVHVLLISHPPGPRHLQRWLHHGLRCHPPGVTPHSTVPTSSLHPLSRPRPSTTTVPTSSLHPLSRPRPYTTTEPTLPLHPPSRLGLQFIPFQEGEVPHGLCADNETSVLVDLLVSGNRVSVSADACCRWGRERALAFSGGFSCASTTSIKATG